MKNENYTQKDLEREACEIQYMLDHPGHHRCEWCGKSFGERCDMITTEDWYHSCEEKERIEVETYAISDTQHRTLYTCNGREIVVLEDGQEWLVPAGNPASIIVRIGDDLTEWMLGAGISAGYFMLALDYTGVEAVTGCNMRTQ